MHFIVDLTRNSDKKFISGPRISCAHFKHRIKSHYKSFYDLDLAIPFDTYDTMAREQSDTRQSITFRHERFSLPSFVGQGFMNPSRYKIDKWIGSLCRKYAMGTTASASASFAFGLEKCVDFVSCIKCILRTMMTLF